MTNQVLVRNGVYANKPVVNHKDGIKVNNNVENLEWATYKENSIHAIENNLAPKGEMVGTSILKSQQVLEILNLYNRGGVTLKELGKVYKVHWSTIQAIVKRRNWKHLDSGTDIDL